ncbi:Uncharacterised protein [uncultured archaeon]|nr:Uncharacterised protein [uncultured archaeon]
MKVSLYWLNTFVLYVSVTESVRPAFSSLIVAAKQNFSSHRVTISTWKISCFVFE